MDADGTIVGAGFKPARHRGMDVSRDPEGFAVGFNFVFHPAHPIIL